MANRDVPLALQRFGLGPRPGNRAGLTVDPRLALKQQLGRADVALIRDASLPTSWAAARALAQARLIKRAGETPTPGPQPASPTVDLAAATASGDPGLIRRSVYRAEVAARLQHGAATDAGFVERLVLFWSNHFAVSVDKGPVHVMAGAFEREAIRPHVLGRFADLLKAVEQHPAMLVFLDNQRSTGPQSPAGLRTGAGLNENLAREALELHTLGADGGYTQADVTGFARVLTGWGWVPPRADRDDAGQFTFAARRHEPGDVTILGKDYAAGGVEQGEAVLADLARHPSTTTHLARKLAAHFIADDPPAGAVSRIAEAFRQSDGDLAAVAAALVDAPEAWDPILRKVRTPYEFVLAAARVEPRLLTEHALVQPAFAALGQRVFAPPSPKGWPDEAAAWLAPHAFGERLDWATLVAERYPPTINPEAVADDLFGPSLSVETRLAVSRAQTGSQGLALLLMSPEFQRR